MKFFLKYKLKIFALLLIGIVGYFFMDLFYYVDISSLNLSDDKNTAIGTCNEDAWRLGNRQKVVSFCLFGKNERYWSGLDENLKAIRKIYPGWYVRIYARGSILSQLSYLLEDHPHLFFCNVENLPPPYKNISNSNPRVWRFSPMADPQVELALFRDSDSRITPREAVAVKEWIASNFTLHSMRDYPGHKDPILGGMWGVRLSNPSKRRILEDSFKKIIIASRDIEDKGIDQVLLRRFVWPHFWLDNFSHDSYHCLWYFFSHPWSTKREDISSFVGHPEFRGDYQRVLPQCPWICRPHHNKDWLYC